MISNLASRFNSKRLRAILFIAFILLLSILALQNNITNIIKRPLEIRTDIQAQLLAEEVTFSESDYVELLQATEENHLIEDIEYGIFSEGQFLWSHIQNTVSLMSPSDETYSQLNYNGLNVMSPFQIEDQIYYLRKFYPRRILTPVLNEVVFGQLGLSLLLALLLYLFYRWDDDYKLRPLRDIQEAIERISQEDYSFKYKRINQAELDSLGESVMSLTQELNEKGIELASSENRLTLLLDHLNLGVMLINQDGMIELLNPEAMELLNLNPEAQNKSFLSVIRSYTLVEMISNVLKTHRSSSDEIELYVPNTKYIDVNIIPYGPAKEKIESILVLLYDISAIRRLETVRTEFVANASHELRTPVTAIKGFAETLLDGAMATPELAEKFVTIIANESNRLEIIINDILELSRVEKRSEPIVIKPFDIVHVAKNLIEFFYKNANEKDITISMDAQGPIIIHADQHRIEQIFTNLIDNAINYSDIASEVKIEIKQEGEEVVFSVADNGIGIPEEDQDRIFERFYRVDKARSRNSGGTGLGLSIVRNLIKLMDGHIQVESALGAGSKFIVTLPLN